MKEVRVVLFTSNPRSEIRGDIPKNGKDHFEYVLHDGKLFVKVGTCDRHDEQGRILAYVQNPYVTV